MIIYIHVNNKYATCIYFLKKLLEVALQWKDKGKKKTQAHSKLKAALKKQK